MKEIKFLYDLASPFPYLHELKIARKRELFSSLADDIEPEEPYLIVYSEYETITSYGTREVTMRIDLRRIQQRTVMLYPQSVEDKYFKEETSLKQKIVNCVKYMKAGRKKS